MNSTWKNVRVFISSTFRDMHAERDHLVTVVFPELRERVEQLGLEFFDVDLRWGVPEKNADGERANSWEYCRQWIDRVEPFFVCILGQRYGWVPEPGDFKSDSDKLRQASEPRSITDLEVRHAVLDDRKKRRSYFYLRQADAPPDAIEYVDLPPLLRKLEQLKTEVLSCGRPVRDYPCEWTGSGFVGMDEFGRQVLDDLWSGVLREERYVSKDVWRQVLGTDPDTDRRYTDESQPVPRELWERIVALARPEPREPLEAEREQMDAFAAARLRWFQGRTGELEKLVAFVGSTDENAPRFAVVAAEPGQGKSALLARLSTLVADASTVLITHFVGATERSASIHALVERLLGELDRSGIAWLPDRQEEGSEPKRDFNNLCLRLAQRLRDYSDERHIVILLDALNQLSDGHDLQWLPARLGPGVRVIVSCIEDAATKAGSPEQRVLQALDSRQPAPLRVPLGPLTEADVRTIVVAYLQEYCHELDREHLDTLCAIPQAQNPLYLLVMLNELRTLGGNDLNRTVPALIASMPQDHPDTVSLFRWVLQRLEVFGEGAVRWWCLYLAHGRVGMASHELADLLARKVSSEGATAAEDAKRTALRIERGLRRYLQSRGAQLDFFHGQLRQAAFERYGPQVEAAGIHADIASYFRALADPGRDQSWMGDSARGFLEVAFHLAAASQLDALCQTLCDMRFVEARCRGGQLFELIADYQLAKESLPEAQADLHEKRDRENRARRWAQETIAYAREWSERRDRAARGEAVPQQEPPCPEPVPLCEMWSEAAVRAERDRVVHSPTRRDSLDTFASFSISQSYPLEEFGSHPGFVAQHAFNFAPSGPVHESGRLCLSAEHFPTVLRRSTADAAMVVRPACERILAAHKDAVTCVDVSADGLRAISGSLDGTLRLWDLESGACLRTLVACPPVAGFFDHGGVVCVSMTPDGRRAVSLGNDTVRVWDLETGANPVAFAGCRLQQLSTTPDGRMAITGSYFGALHVWDLESATCLRTLQQDAEERSNPTHVAIAPDGRRAVSNEDQDSLHVLKVWDVGSGECLCLLQGHHSDIRHVAVTGDGRCAVSGDDDGTIRTWDLQTGTCLHVLEGCKLSSGWCLTPDGSRVIGAGIYRELQVWGLASGSCLRTLEGHSDFVHDVSATVDGRCVVSASSDRTLRVWNLESGECPPAADRHICSVRSVTLARSGRVAISIGDFYDTTLRVWDVGSGSCLRRLESTSYDERWNEGSAVDGRQATSATEGAFRTWNIETGACVGRQQGRGYGRSINGAVICMTPDGRRSVIGGGLEETLRVWDLKSGTCLRTLNGHEGWVTTACLAPEGLRAVSGSRDKTLRVWDLASGHCLRELAGHDGYILGVDVTPDGRRVVSASADRTLRIWDLESGESVRVLEGHTHSVKWVSALADGRHVASGSYDKTVRVWNLLDGECLAVFFAGARVTAGTVLGEQLVVGLETGDVVFADLRNFAWGVPVVSAVNHRHARCPACGEAFTPMPAVAAAIHDADPRGLSSRCPNCGRPLQFNPFFSGTEDYANLLRRGLELSRREKGVDHEETLAHLSALVVELETKGTSDEARLLAQERDRVAAVVMARTQTS